MKKTGIFMALGGLSIGGALYAYLTKKDKNKNKALKELL